MPKPLVKPAARRAIGAAAILTFLLVYIVGIGSLSGLIGATPWWAQALIYLVAGVIWVFPLRPVFTWMSEPITQSSSKAQVR